MSGLGSVRVDEFDAERDSLQSITAMLHRAYARLVARGLNYMAGSQSVEVTAKRLRTASLALIALHSDVIVGTIAYYDRMKFDGGPAWFARDGVGLFAQFGVEPALQGMGVGRVLLEAVEARALADGRTELACDTALDAVGLVGYYERLGFRIVGEHRYERATYRSVILSKSLRS
jgi:GNAT superfamily N-acetyltransferase